MSKIANVLKELNEMLRTKNLTAYLNDEEDYTEFIRLYHYLGDYESLIANMGLINSAGVNLSINTVVDIIENYFGGLDENEYIDYRHLKLPNQIISKEFFTHILQHEDISEDSFARTARYLVENFKNSNELRNILDELTDDELFTLTVWSKNICYFISAERLGSKIIPMLIEDDASSYTLKQILNEHDTFIEIPERIIFEIELKGGYTDLLNVYRHFKEENDMKMEEIVNLITNEEDYSKGYKIYGR